MRPMNYSKMYGELVSLLMKLDTNIEPDIIELFAYLNEHRPFHSCNELCSICIKQVTLTNLIDSYDQCKMVFAGNSRGREHLEHEIRDTLLTDTDPNYVLLISYVKFSYHNLPRSQFKNTII